MTNNQTEAKRDMASIIAASVFILIGPAALWDTTSMIDPDSYIFPRVIAIAMMVFCLLLIITKLIRPSLPKEYTATTSDFSTPRRILLVVAMLGGTALMPIIGFLLSGIAAFSAIIVISMYNPWTPFRRVTFPLAGLAIVLGFYTVFTKILLVPLPTGLFFD